MKKSLKFGLTTALSALTFGLVGTAAYTLTTVNAENEAPAITTATFEMEVGGSVRTKNPTGIRFTTYVNETYYASLENQDFGFGTLVMPKSLLGEAELTHAVTSAADIEVQVWADSEVENYMRYTAVLTDIPDTRYAEVLVARSYVRIGTEYTYATNPQERSIAEIAAKALAANEKDEDGVLLSYVEAVATGVTLDKADAVVATGGNVTLAATTAPFGYAVVWETSNPEIATVKNGVVTGVAEGEVVITAKFGTKTAACVVTVKDNAESSYQLADVGAVTLNELGALTWEAVATTQGNIAADKYEVTVADEEGNENVYTVSENAYMPYTLAAGTYTATVKAASAKSWISTSANASEAYKFVVTRHKDWAASDIDTSNGAFAKNEHNTVAEYNAESGYAQIKNDNCDYGVIVSKDGVMLDMATNPIIVLDTVAAKGKMYFKMSYDGSNQTEHNDGGKVYVVKDTDLGEYAEDKYLAFRANTPVENSAIADTVTNFKVYPGISSRDGYITLRGMYIVSVNEYVEPPVELVKLDSVTNFVLNKGVVSATAPANKLVEATITYTVTVTGENVNYQVTNAAMPTVDLTALGLVSGKVYTVGITANGDEAGLYHAASDEATVQIQYTESYKTTDFSAASISFRDGSNALDGNKIKAERGGNYGLYSLNIPMDGVRLTADSVVVVKFGEVSGDTKYWTGFFKGKSGGEPRDGYFEDIVQTNGTCVVTGFYNSRNSYVIDNVLYYGFGIGGHGGDNRYITIASVTVADYAFYPCEATSETVSVAFDKAASANQEIRYQFYNGATLDSVAIDGKTLSGEQYTDMVNSVILNASVLETYSYGEHTVTLTDNRGYSVSVKLVVSSSALVTYGAGRVEWSEYGDVAGYKVQVYSVDNMEEAVLEETVTATSYVIANKNLNGNYKVVVSAVYEEAETVVMGEKYLSIEKLLYWGANELMHKDAGHDGSKYDNGASAKYDEEKGVVRVTAKSDVTWGSVFTNDFKAKLSDDTYFVCTFGEVSHGYYVKIMQDGKEAYSSGDVKNNNTLIVRCGDVGGLAKNNGDINSYMKLGTTQGNGSFVEYVSVSICNITAYTPANA